MTKKFPPFWIEGEIFLRVESAEIFSSNKQERGDGLSSPLLDIFAVSLPAIGSRGPPATLLQWLRS